MQRKTVDELQIHSHLFLHVSSSQSTHHHHHFMGLAVRAMYLESFVRKLRQNFLLRVTRPRRRQQCLASCAAVAQHLSKELRKRTLSNTTGNKPGGSFVQGRYAIKKTSQPSFAAHKQHKNEYTHKQVPNQSS